MATLFEPKLNMKINLNYLDGVIQWLIMTESFIFLEAGDRKIGMTFTVSTSSFENGLKFSKNKFTFSQPVPRRRHSSVFLGDQMIIFGGFDGDFYNDMHYATFITPKTEELLESTYLKDTLK
jgi:hypothetical protein